MWNCPCLIWCCLSVIITSIMASKQQQGFRMSVLPCPRYLTGGDTQILCVAYLGEEHARSALERFFPEGQPLSHDQGHVAMFSCLGNVEETVVPVPGSRAGSFMSSQNANGKCLSHGLGSDPRRTLESRSVEGPASLMVHQPSGDVGCISCSQEFPNKSQGQHICGLLHKSPGGFAVTSTLQIGMPNPPVVPKEVVVSSSSLHPGDPQYRSRHPVETGAEARGWFLAEYGS